MRSAARPAPRSAFTLVEMLVSLAVLSLALSIVGVVFTVTTKTASQAAAYSEVQNWGRQAGLQIEEDLRNIDPAESVMLVASRVQPAALTQDDLTGGRYERYLVGNPDLVDPQYDPRFSSTLDPDLQYSNPRADQLMFITNRPGSSQAPVSDPAAISDPDQREKQQSYASGARFGPMLVVYGHAAIGQPVFDPSNNRFEFPNVTQLKHIEQLVRSDDNRSILPLSRWHLARRATIIEPALPEVGKRPKTFFSNNDRGSNEWERLWSSMPDDGNGYAGDVARLDLRALLALFGPQLPLPIEPSDKDTNWQRQPAELRPYDFPSMSNPRVVKLEKQTVDDIYSLMYFNGQDGPNPNHHVATVIENPPGELRSNLGNHLLPGCAWFQVEFLMPEDARNSLDYDRPLVLEGRNINRDLDWQEQGKLFSRRTDAPRWTSVEVNPEGGETAYCLFVPDSNANRDLISSRIKPLGSGTGSDGGPGDAIKNSRLTEYSYVYPTKRRNNNEKGRGLSNRRVRLWPYAIRVTVKVYDPRGRLSEPLVRTFVHRFE